jgi:hypothetical protein
MIRILAEGFCVSQLVAAAILMVLSVLTGCSPKVPSPESRATMIQDDPRIVPCDTDSDCCEKNPEMECL